MTDAAPIIDASGIDKFYESFQALFDISLQVMDGEFVALVGPSGCGKTSLLKILAGFEQPTKGKLEIQGKSVVGLPPSQRPTRMVFQKLALFPHKSVRDNIAFPLKLAKVDMAEQDARIAEMMDLMHLPESYASRYPAQLSGGEQQRVALARSMISRPSVLLLDEPLSALDVKLKKVLQTEIKHLHRTIGTSFVHVTHDLEEAMMLADRICVMRKGRILQNGSPSDIYYRPADAFVAGFIGETNLIPVQIDGAAFANPVLKCAAPMLEEAQFSPSHAGSTGLLMIRPELITMHIKDAKPGNDTCIMTGQVEEFFIKGASIQYRITVDGVREPMIVDVLGTAIPPADVAQRVWLSFARSDLYLLGEY
ncbi:ABC transporter ATP-binding protein [Roseovarius sp. Pro17]|uniref:ABC transporter ATP-binding protein n=1 Tax=Roseovarius sp. Pro17 TaxID=3108175 RepID=UPI002D7940F0|nr:ABC transporter ATP-binding protein [Roseovarius sp. Pro17]